MSIIKTNTMPGSLEERLLSQPGGIETLRKLHARIIGATARACEEASEIEASFSQGNARLPINALTETEEELLVNVARGALGVNTYLQQEAREARDAWFSALQQLRHYAAFLRSAEREDKAEGMEARAHAIRDKHAE